MSVLFHVNGLAQIGINFLPLSTTGSGSLLGYSIDGVTVELIYETSDVLTDKWGTKIPEDVQNMGEWALITAKLIKYDTAILAEVQSRVTYDGTQGDMPNVNASSKVQIGSLMGQCDNMIQLYISMQNPCANESEGPWTFGAAYLMGPDKFKLGTTRTDHEIQFRCLPNVSGILYRVG